MHIEIKLFAFFRENRFSSKMYNFPEGTTVEEIIEHFSINKDEVGVTMINGRHCKLNSVLCENDSLGIFPLIGGG